MPKVKGTLSDVSTTFTPIIPDSYEFKIVKVEEENFEPDSERPHGQTLYTVVSAIDQPTSDENGRQVWDRIYYFKKDGTVNEYSARRLKQYFVAVHGEDEVNTWADADYDTDKLPGGRFQGEIIHEPWQNEVKKTSGVNAVIKTPVPLD